jgi:hypothetical protein
MRTNKYSRGSAHVIVIVLLVVALLGLLGFVLYQNIMLKEAVSSDTNKPPETTSQSSNAAAEQVPDLVKGSIDASFGTTLGFKYPSTWKYSQKMAGTIESQGSWTQKITLTSPTGNYTVQYFVGAGGGLGGMCNPSEMGQIASTNYEVVPGFSGMSYIELTYRNVPNDVTNKIGVVELIDSATASSVEAGDSVCDTYLHEVVKLADANYVQLIGATMIIDGASTAEELKRALSGTEYEQGKAILLSTTH